MIRHRLLVFTATLTLLASGCRSSGSDAVPSTLPGSYVYAGKGSTFKKPWEFRARLDLTGDARYKLTLDKTARPTSSS